MEAAEQQLYTRMLEEAVRHHGDACRGVELGTRMALVGLREIGITDPKGTERKSLLVFVEIDRCATDAITALTGCRPGKRSMKVFDYGKMAATFLNTRTGRAVRVSLKPRMRDMDPDRPLDTYAEEDLLRITVVKVPLRREDLPGKPSRICTCAMCGENVLDGREGEVDGKVLCRTCFEGASYYEVPDDNASA